MNPAKVHLRVLVVEDNPHDAELVIHELQRGGFEPEWRRVETEAEYLGALEESVDLILADYTLPSFSAPRALDLLMTRHIDLPFIIVTGTVGEQPVLDCLRKGADDYLIKDRLGRLPMAVRAAIAGRALRSERQMADDRARLQARLLDAVEQAVIATNVNGTITYWNAAAERLYGWTEPEAVGHHLLDITGTDNHAADTGHSWSGVVTVQRKNGTDFMAQVTESPIRDAAGHVIGVTVVSIDATDRLKAEEALRRSEERLRVITNHLPDLVSQVALDGTFLFVSPSHQEVLGYSPHELVGRSAFDLVHPDDLAAIRPRIDAAIRACATERLTFRFRRADGDYVWLDTSAQLLLGASGIPVGAVLSARETSEPKPQRSIAGAVS